MTSCRSKARTTRTPSIFVKAADATAKAMADNLDSSSTFGLIASTLDAGTKGIIVANHCYTVLSVYKVCEWHLAGPPTESLGSRRF